MGGQNTSDISLILKRLISLRFEGLLEQGQHDWMHILGISKLEWACVLTDMQRAIRKHHNENFTLSFDCASPFLATANGQLYTSTRIIHDKKWSYRMEPSVDDKKYATDSRRFGDAVLTDKVFAKFEESPISERMQISDVCHYKPGDLNKIGKEGRTSWDSFSYALQMAHNVHRHIYAVQEANRQYDADLHPATLRRTASGDLETTRQIIDEIFATSSRSEAEALIVEHTKFWDSIIGGARGNTGKKIINSQTKAVEFFGAEIAKGAKIVVEKKAPATVLFGGLFEGFDDEAPEEADETNEDLDDTSLNILEESVECTSKK